MPGASAGALFELAPRAPTRAVRLRGLAMEWVRSGGHLGEGGETGGGRRLGSHAITTPGRRALADGPDPLGQPGAPGRGGGSRPAGRTRPAGVLRRRRGGPGAAA